MMPIRLMMMGGWQCSAILAQIYTIFYFVAVESIFILVYIVVVFSTVVVKYVCMGSLTCDISNNALTQH